MNEDESNRAASWLGPRRKVISHEVAKPADSAGAAAQPVHVVVVPAAAGSHATRRPEVVLDPTLFSERRRKHRHQTIYHLTQIAIVGTFAAAALGIVGPLVGRARLAQESVGAAALLALLSYRLVRMTGLSRRLRGYAVAGIVLALLAGAVNVGAMLISGPTGGGGPEHAPASSPANAAPHTGP